VRWINDDPAACPGIDPTVGRALAGENKSMYTPQFNYSKFKIAAEGSRRDGLPYELIAHRFQLTRGSHHISRAPGSIWTQ